MVILLRIMVILLGIMVIQYDSITFKCMTERAKICDLDAETLLNFFMVILYFYKRAISIFHSYLKNYHRVAFVLLPACFLKRTIFALRQENGLTVTWHHEVAELDGSEKSSYGLFVLADQQEY